MAEGIDPGYAAKLVMYGWETVTEALKHGGVTNMMRNLEIERLGLAAMSLGLAKRCLDVMTRYAVDRKAFGTIFFSYNFHNGETQSNIHAYNMKTKNFNVDRIGPDKINI